MKTLKKQTILVLILSVFMNFSLSAQVIAVQGKVYDERSGKAIGQAKITLLGHAAVSYSDQEGKFLLQASIGEKLCFEKEGYVTDTVLINKAYLNVALKKKPTISELLANSEGPSVVEGDIKSIRGQREDAQVVLIDGVRVTQFEKKKVTFKEYVEANFNKTVCPDFKGKVVVEISINNKNQAEIVKIEGAPCESFSGELERFTKGVKKWNIRGETIVLEFVFD